MNNPLHQKLFICLFIFASADIEVFAQENGSPSFEAYDTEVLANREKVSREELTDPIKQTARQKKDSVSIRPNQLNLLKAAPSVPNSAVKPPTTRKAEDESILSFNFLYYLIQKYKFQDFVD